MGNVIANAAYALGLNPSTGLLDELVNDGNHLEDFRYNFTQLINNLSVPLHCFFESHPTDYGKYVKKYTGLPFRLDSTVVPETSACLGIGARCQLDSDHFKLNKFNGPSSADYTSVAYVICSMITNAITTFHSRNDRSSQSGASGAALLTKSTLTRYSSGNFAGRLSYLTQIESLFENSPLLHQVVVLNGLSGIGKSQIAMKYAESIAFTHSTFLLQVSDTTTIIQGLRKIIQKLHPMHEANSQSAEAIFSIAMDLLSSHPHPWLLILDGADDKDMFLGKKGDLPPLIELFPRTPNGRILITTMSMSLAELGNGLICPASNAIHVREMTESDGVQLLQSAVAKPLHRQLGIDNRSACATLVRLLGALPLALVQATAYILTLRLPLQDFIQQFQHAREHEELFKYAAYSTPTERKSVLVTWELAYRKLTPSKEANLKSVPAKILDLIGFFSPFSIPLLAINTLLIAITPESFSIEDAMSELLDLSLIIDVSDDGLFGNIHPMVHEWAYQRLSPEEKWYYASMIVNYWGWSFQQPDFLSGESRVTWYSLDNHNLSHASRASSLASDIGLDTKEHGDFLLSLGRCLGRLGCHTAAVPLFQEAISIPSYIPLQSRFYKYHSLACAYYFALDIPRAIHSAKICVRIASTDFEVAMAKEALRNALHSDGQHGLALQLDHEILSQLEGFPETDSPWIVNRKLYIARDILQWSRDEDEIALARELATTNASLIDGKVAPVEYKILTGSFATQLPYLWGLEGAFGEASLDLQSLAAHPHSYTIASSARKQLLELQVRDFGFEHNGTVQLAEQHMRDLLVEGEWMEVAAWFSCLEKPRNPSGIALQLWCHILNHYGVALRGLDELRLSRAMLEVGLDFAQRIPSTTPVSYDIANVSQEYPVIRDSFLVTMTVINIAFTLATQKNLADLAQLRLKHPSLVQWEEQYGTAEKWVRDGMEEKSRLRLKSHLEGLSEPAGRSQIFWPFLLIGGSWKAAYQWIALNVLKKVLLKAPLPSRILSRVAAIDPTPSTKFGIIIYVVVSLATSFMDLLDVEERLRSEEAQNGEPNEFADDFTKIWFPEDGVNALLGILTMYALMRVGKVMLLMLPLHEIIQTYVSARRPRIEVVPFLSSGVVGQYMRHGLQRLMPKPKKTTTENDPTDRPVGPSLPSVPPTPTEPGDQDYLPTNFSVIPRAEPYPSDYAPYLPHESNLLATSTEGNLPGSIQWLCRRYMARLRLDWSSNSWRRVLLGGTFWTPIFILRYVRIEPPPEMTALDNSWL